MAPVIAAVQGWVSKAAAVCGIQSTSRHNRGNPLQSQAPGHKEHKGPLWATLAPWRPRVKLPAHKPSNAWFSGGNTPNSDDHQESEPSPQAEAWEAGPARTSDPSSSYSTSRSSSGTQPGGTSSRVSNNISEGSPRAAPAASPVPAAGASSSRGVPRLRFERKPRPSSLLRKEAPPAGPRPPPEAEAEESNPTLCFPGGGMFFFWQAGAAQFLMERFELDSTPMFGASAGSLTAVLLACKVDFPSAIQACYHIAMDRGLLTRRLGVLGAWGPVIREWLHHILPEDAAERCRGRVQIAVYSLDRVTPERLPLPLYKAGKRELISDFRDKEDLIDCILSSVHIPLLMDGRLTGTLRGQRMVDGSWGGARKDLEATSDMDMVWVDSNECERTQSLWEEIGEGRDEYRKPISLAISLTGGKSTKELHSPEEMGQVVLEWVQCLMEHGYAYAIHMEEKGLMKCFEIKDQVEKNVAELERSMQEGFGQLEAKVEADLARMEADISDMGQDIESAVLDLERSILQEIQDIAGMGGDAATLHAAMAEIKQRIHGDDHR